MPKITMTLKDTEQSVFRPIVHSVLKDIKDITGVGDDIEILFPSASGKIQNKGSTINDTDRNVAFQTRSFLHVEIDTRFDEDKAYAMDGFGVATHPVFLDKKYGVRITPLYSTREVEIRLRYRDPSKTAVERWSKDIRLRMAQLRDVNVHEFSYNYELPETMLRILGEVYKAQETTEAYKRTFDDYLTSHLARQARMLSNDNGEWVKLVIAETQSRAVGYFDFEMMPDKPNYLEDVQSWEVEFSYKFQYDDPFAMGIKYPVMVHQNLLPEDLVVFDRKKLDLRNQNQKGDGRTGPLFMFEQGGLEKKPYEIEPYLRVPSFDDWILPNPPTYTGTVFVALCQMERGSNELLNLKELGEITLDPDTIDFLKSGEYRHIGVLGNSAYYLSVYENDYQLTSDSWTLDEDLNLSLNFDADLRAVYRVRLSLFVKVDSLSSRARDALLGHPRAFKRVIGSMNELIAQHPDLTKIGRSGKVTSFEFSAVYRIITGQGTDIKPYIESGSSLTSGLNSELFSDVDPEEVQRLLDTSITMKTLQNVSVVARRLNN